MIYLPFKSAIRALWKNRLFTGLHISGLAIGLASAWVVWQYASHELGHNRQIPDGDRLFRVVSNFTFDGKPSGNAGCPEPLGHSTDLISGIEMAVPARDCWASAVRPEGMNSPVDEPEGITRTTADYFRLVPHRWLAGSRSEVLKNPDEVVLTEASAAIYFPRLSPDEILGKTVRYEFWDDTVNAKVTGIVADLDFPSSFTGRDFLALRKPKEDAWTSTNSNDQLWLLLQKNTDPKTVEAAVNDLSAKHSGDLAKWNMTRSHSLQPLADVHFDEDFVSHLRVANPKVLGVLPWVGLFLLALACINYMNLSTAQIPARAREIGIRKTLGSSRRSLIFGFLGETFLTCLLAAGLAVFLTKWAFHYFEKDLPEDVLKYADWKTTGLFLAALVSVVTLVSGLWPAWLVGKFQAVSLLRGQFSGQTSTRANRAGLRKGLIVFQFFVAQLFIIGAVFVGRQLNFMLNTDLGFNREGVLVAQLPFRTLSAESMKGRDLILAERLRQLPEIGELALGDELFSGSFSSNKLKRTDPNGQLFEHSMYRKRGDTSLISFYRIPLLAGRLFASNEDDSELVINEAALKAFGFDSPQAAIGQTLSVNRPKKDEQVQIVGVVKNFFTGTFAETVKPTALMGYGNDGRLGTFNIRLASQRTEDWPAAIQKIGAEWSKIYPDDPFEGRFYDESMREIYAADLSVGRLVNAATGIAIFISCLGLFGLATFTALRRTKEIGIRKTLGASATSVVGLLSREFLLLVAVGFLLAVPPAIYFLKKWLGDYAHRVDLDWKWMALAGLTGSMLAFLTVGFQAVKAAMADPVKSLRSD